MPDSVDTALDTLPLDTRLHGDMAARLATACPLLATGLIYKK